MTSWHGRNGFRMMPADAMREAPASAELSLGNGGQELLLTYEWEHPDDGPQDGVLLVGSPTEGTVVSASWGDSWHQHPGLMQLVGSSTDGRIELVADYGGGWGWQIELDVADAALRLAMSNVIPAEHATDDAPAGPYTVMVAELSLETVTPTR